MGDDGGNARSPTWSGADISDPISTDKQRTRARASRVAASQTKSSLAYIAPHGLGAVTRGSRLRNRRQVSSMVGAQYLPAAAHVLAGRGAPGSQALAIKDGRKSPV